MSSGSPLHVGRLQYLFARISTLAGRVLTDPHRRRRRIMDQKLGAFSIIDPKCRAAHRKLSSINISRFKTNSRTALRNSASVNWAVLGVDISMNDDTEKALGIAWQAHLYGIGE